MFRCFMLILVCFLQLGLTKKSLHPQEFFWDNDDLVRCTVGLIAELQNGIGTVKVYESSSTSSIVHHVENHLFRLQPPIPTVHTDSREEDQMNSEQIWLTEVADPKQLKSVMGFIREVHHQQLIVCITYFSKDPFEELSQAASAIWVRKIPRNVVFIVSNHNRIETLIIGVSGYNLDNCEEIHLHQVGVYHDDILIHIGPSFYPHFKNLGGCELTVMIQPALPPYVETKHSIKPGGFAGELIGSLGVMMNFTPKYVWSSSNEALMNHIEESDLNLAVDLGPRPLRPARADRFAVGMVLLAFIVPRLQNPRSGLFLFIAPFGRSVWLVIALVLCALLGTSCLAKDADSVDVILKILGSFLGIGVGRFPKSDWMKVFQWFWLLSCFIITQSYLATIKKELTVPTMELEINTIAELIDSQLDIPCTSATKEVFCNSGRWPVALGDRCRIVTSEYFDEFYANLQISGAMNNTARLVSIERLESAASLANVHVISDYMINRHQFIEVHAGSSYISEMKKYFDRLAASGLISFWKNHYSSKNRRVFTDTTIVSDMVFIEYCVIFLFTGLSVSCICFLGELIIHRFYSQTVIWELQ